ncbi:uncharacterized protein LOC117318989 [Pecten maximus]|uniref:uncharacterized protein LOC117318989 n=1 Tax=Pecten maximus TaxID=6579 RepID=UPI001458900B|nr:uncharacterized protein LOC117318989 [Pecten maximus]
MDELLAGDPAVRPGTIVSSLEGNSSTIATASAGKAKSPEIIRKEKKKRKREEMPEWFRDFSEKQNNILTEIKDTQKKAVEVAAERNAILKSLTSAMLNK